MTVWVMMRRKNGNRNNKQCNKNEIMRVRKTLFLGVGVKNI
jgi:hypothetical protein